MASHEMEETFAGAVTVGERGQVVIPVEAREKLGIEAGEKLLVFCHPAGHGVLFAKLGELRRFTEAVRPLLQTHEDDEGHSAEDEE